MKSVVRKAVMAAVTAAIVVSGALPAAATFSGDNGRIVSVHRQYDWDNCPDPENGGHCDAPPELPSEIISSTVTGDDVVNLGQGTQATYSADGTKIAYVSDGAIWTMDADGQNKVQLTEPVADEFADWRPAWAPGGKRLVFERANADGVTLYIVSADGETERELTPGLNAEWSSKNKIAFIDRTQDGRSVATINPDGTGRTVVERTKRATDVSWGPAGKRLAFIKPAEEKERQCLVLINPADTDTRRALTCGLNGRDGGDVVGLSWAPNGRSLLVSLEDLFDEPAYSEARAKRFFLDRDKAALEGIGLYADWGVKTN